MGLCLIAGVGGCLIAGVGGRLITDVGVDAWLLLWGEVF